MAERKTYKEMLLDPRWQKKRLKVLEAAEWKCWACDGTSQTLHVHHMVYWPGCAPWEYPDEWLVALCSDCHADFTEDDRRERERDVAAGREPNFSKRIFSYLPVLSQPCETEELVWRLGQLHSALIARGVPYGALTLLGVLADGDVPAILARALESSQRDSSVPPERFEAHLARAADEWVAWIKGNLG